MSGTTAQELRTKAQSLEHSNGARTALDWLSDQLNASAQNADIWNFAGNLAMRAQDWALAASYFGKAAQLSPNALENAINQAIALSAAGDHKEALRVLAPHEKAGERLPRYGSVRANAARNSGDLNEAAHWYDRVLALDPHHKKALNGRARVAIERAEGDALSRFDSAITLDRSNADLWLGRAQALDVNGDTAGALSLAQQLVDQAPSWIEGLRFLAQLKLATGEENSCDHYRIASERAPQDPNILNDWIVQLAGLDHNQDAAEIAAKARRQFPEQPHFALLEAIHAGEAGDDARAQELFDQIQEDGTDRHLHEARHRIRRREFDRAEASLDTVINRDPWSISAWALQGLVWRCCGDNRAEWLHGQPNVFGASTLSRADTVMEPVIALLHALHDHSPLPLGQSLRGGSQTRGNLFDRLEPEFAVLKEAILDTVHAFVGALPPLDETHPLLRHKDAMMEIGGSWSVRLSGGRDHHTSHIHPQGLLSSALYLDIPESAGRGDDKAGYLEIGRPPIDLRLDLEPLATIQPRPGVLALFPSTLYHGTRPFPQGRRMTVAFDVVSGK